MKNIYFKLTFVILSYLAMISTFMPWYSDLLKSVYWSHANEEDYDSVQSAGQAVSFNPFSIDARFALADAQMKKGFWEDSRKSLISATELEPLNYFTWKQLAYYEAHFWNDIDDARSHYKKGIELNSKDELLKEEARKELGEAALLSDYSLTT